MLAYHSYEDLKLVVLTQEENESYFEFLKLTPFVWNDEKSFRFFGTCKDEIKQISNYLNEKYNNKIKNSMIKYNKRYKKKISLYSVDLFNPKGHRLWLKNKLKDKFRIKFAKYKPDYLIYNVFGNEHLNEKYSNSIKIAIFTENRIPDLNKADYAIGQAHINYFDRYFKFPVFLWRNIKIIEKLREKSLESPIRKKFCAAVISNNMLTDGLRTKFIDLIKIKAIIK